MTKTGWFVFLTLLIATRAVAQNNISKDTLFKPSGNLSGYVFGDYTYMVQADQQKRGTQQYSGLKKDHSSFNIRRLYLQYGYQFSPNISTHITLAHESGMEANSDKTNLLPDGNRSVFIKHAYLQIEEVIPRAAIVLGQQATPTFSRLSESIWGYRSIEKTLADMRGISSSSDLGVGIYGRIGTKERFGYDLLYANNSGTKFKSDTHKKLYTSLYAYFLDKKLITQVNYEYNKTAPFPDISGNTQLLKAFVGYKTSRTAVGLEVFKQFNKNATSYLSTLSFADSLTTTRAATGVSLFFTQNLRPKKLEVFARVDWFDPDVNYTSNSIYLEDYPSTKELFATVGVDYEVFENIHIMPNLWLNHYKSKGKNGNHVPKSGVDPAGRMTVYYRFNK